MNVRIPDPDHTTTCDSPNVVTHTTAGRVLRVCRTCRASTSEPSPSPWRRPADEVAR